MPNIPATIKQAELTRYLKAVRAAGVEVGQVRIAKDGTVTITPLGVVSSDGANPCDELLK